MTSLIEIAMNNGKHVNMLYTYLGSQNTGEAKAVIHINRTNKNIINLLYCLL